MAFNISRQPLVPAFLVLAALAIATVFGITSSQDAAAGSVVQPLIETLTTSAPHSAATSDLQLELPENWLTALQSAFPVWSSLIAGLVIVFTAMVLGRIAIRYNLHAVNTCISIPLFGIVACGLPSGEDYLTAFVGAALLALSIKHYARAFCNGYGFDGIFRAAFYQGALLVLFPATAPLLLLLPLAVLLFRRTLREAIVGLFGASVLPLLFCYVNWGAGGSFAAPLQHLASQVTTGEFFGLFRQLPLPILGMLGGVVLLDLFAVMFFLSDVYNVGTKPRFIQVFNSSVLLLTAAILCLPGASPTAFALLAVPSAMLLPVLFVRIHRWIALSLYLLLLAGAFAGAVLQ